MLPSNASNLPKLSKPARGAASCVTNQVFPFLLARNCRTLPSNAPNPPKLPTRLLEVPRNLPNRVLELPNYGLWEAFPLASFRSCQTIWAVISQVFSFLLARNCRMRPKMPDASFKPSKSSETCQTGSWSCKTMAWNCRIFPSKPPNLPKPAKPFLGVANYQL